MAILMKQQIQGIAQKNKMGDIREQLQGLLTLAEKPNPISQNVPKSQEAAPQYKEDTFNMLVQKHHLKLNNQIFYKPENQDYEQAYNQNFSSLLETHEEFEKIMGEDYEEKLNSITPFVYMQI